MQRFTRAFVIFGVLSCAPLAAHDGAHKESVAPWQQASAWPDRVIATFEADPARSLAVSWRTSGDIKATRAEIARAIPDARFDLVAQSEPAQTITIDIDAVTRAGVKIPMPQNEDLPAVSYH